MNQTGNWQKQLTQLGLSPDTATCYLTLMHNGALSAHDIAAKIHIVPNSVYRLIQTLEQRALLVSLDTYPMTYQAVPISVALRTLVDTAIKAFEEIKEQQQITPIPQTKIDIHTGWDKMMETYVKLATHAQKEILIISIGESVPDEVKLVNRDALERGVTIKFIVHVHNKNNRMLLSSWINMGIATRFYPDSGYHLIVIDGKTCVLATSNPQNTKERSTVVIYGEGLSHSMQQHFYTLWAQSQPIQGV